MDGDQNSLHPFSLSEVEGHAETLVYALRLRSVRTEVGLVVMMTAGSFVV